MQAARRHYRITLVRGRRPAFAKATAWLADMALFWGKRVYDFFEVRIAAQRVPEREQFQLAVAHVRGRTNGNGQLFACEIFVTNPSSDHRKIRDHDRSYRFLFDVLKLNRTSTFSERLLFAPEACINETKHAKRRTVVRLRLNDFLL